VSSDDARKELAALERELERARQAAEKNQAALSALDEQRREREGRLTVALRAQQDFERRLEEKRVELARAEAEAAVASFREALADRDAAAEAFASAARSAILLLQELDAAQEAAGVAWDGLVERGAAKLVAAADGLPREDPRVAPAAVAEALAMLTDLVRQRADLELESDLVEAAARSPLGNEIANLPKHLQDLARARFFALARERRSSSEV
jgi:chromosome segregation ATPase